MNYRNEYNRLYGELSRLKPDLNKEEIHKMIQDEKMPREKLEAIGQYIEHQEPMQPFKFPESSASDALKRVKKQYVKTPGVKVEDTEAPKRQRGRPRKAI